MGCGTSKPVAPGAAEPQEPVVDEPDPALLPLLQTIMPVMRGGGGGGEGEEIDPEKSDKPIP